MGILARLHIEGAHLGEHEGGRWSLQLLDGGLKFDYGHQIVHLHVAPRNVD